MGLSSLIVVLTGISSSTSADKSLKLFTKSNHAQKYDVYLHSAWRKSVWNMENETLIDSGHYDYPEDVENWYVFIPQHATMANRVIKSSSIEDSMIYTDTDVTLQDDTVISVLYIHDPETLFVRAITVENGNETTYYRNFLYNADIE